MTTPRIAPSILAADFTRLAEELESIERGGADWVHVDVMDGHFVPNITIGPFIVEAVKRATKLPLDVHLMIEQPERYVDDFVKAGAATVGIHAETCPHLHRSLAQIREAGARACVVLNPSTPAQAIEPVLGDLDQVLVMTVNPGFGGQKFIASMLPKIETLRGWIDERGLEVSLEVDGGIGVETITRAARAGADVFVAGTAVFGAPDRGEAIALDPALSGKAVYAEVLRNRFDTFTQDSSMASGDRGGRTQETRLRMQFKDFRDHEDLPSRGVLSKTLVKYWHPFDLRHSGYLVIQNHARANDQFVYLPTRRQTVRVNLRGEAVFGTDFSFEDVIPRELEDARYQRLEDGAMNERAVYVVEAHPTEEFDSEYLRFRFYVDPRTFVPLRTRYWDRADVEIKELVTRPDDVERMDGIYVPMELTMRHLLLDSYTTLEVTNLVPNAKLTESAFEVRRLEAH